VIAPGWDQITTEEGPNLTSRITKEEAAMEPMVGNDEVTMAKTMMRAKKLLMMKMFVVAEVMRMEMTATKA
jgi:hypothetical protein